MVLELTGSKSEIVMVPYDQAYEAGFEDMPRRVPALDKIQALLAVALVAVWIPARRASHHGQRASVQPKAIASQAGHCLEASGGRGKSVSGTHGF